LDLPPDPVEGDRVQRHAPDLDDQDGLVAVGGQRGVKGLVVRRHPLPAPVGFLSFPGRQLQPPRRLARFHAPGGVRVGIFHVQAELLAEAEVAFYLSYQEGRRPGSVSADHRSSIPVP
jgi:hypothetical protein